MDPGDGGRRARYPLGAAVSVDDLSGSPYPVLAELRAREPVSWLPALGCWLVTRRDLVDTALRDADAFTVDHPGFSTARVVGPSMLSRDGSEHRRHRTPFLRPFRSGTVAEAHGRAVQRDAMELVDAVADRGRAELRTELAGPLAVRVITRFLGLDPGDGDPGEVLGWYRAIVDGVLAVDAGRPVPDGARRAMAALGERVAGRVGPGSALASVMAGADLRDAELVSNVAVVLFGAIETTEGMIANLVYHLLSRPERWAAVEADRRLLDTAIDESLRLEPAAAVVDRYATAEVVFGSPDAPAMIGTGELVRLSLTAANRDPAHHRDPDRFDLGRADAASHLAFVTGPHSCIGANLARLEAHAAVSALLDRLGSLQLDDRRSTPPRGLIFRKPDRVVATWARR